MDLARLIKAQQAAGAGTLRDMERRAAADGTPISRTQLNDYANGVTRAYPSVDRRQAIANAIDVTLEEVTAAALVTAAPELEDSPHVQVQQAHAFVRLTAGRSPEEVEQLLGVVAAALKAMDAHRRSSSEP